VVGTRVRPVAVGAVGIVVAGGAALAATVPGAVNGSAAPLPARVTYSAPLSPIRVVHPFDPPTTPYGPGHLGVDLAASPGGAVVAAGAGTVTFAGSVAGRGLIVLAHPDGVSTEYEPINPLVRRGEHVRRGELIGRVHGTHHRCRPGRCLHWGARRDGEYIDPMSLLHPLGPVRLLPWTGIATVAWTGIAAGVVDRHRGSRCGPAPAHHCGQARGWARS
jgi:murein DD-endopeptidase MepM/ murein hydrolase activator NlpD